MKTGGYLYTYFKSEGFGKDDQRIFFAISRDGLHFHEIRHGQPVLASDEGTKGLRDPHVFQSRIDHKYYLLATDLDCNSNRWKDYSTKGSKKIMVAVSEDLVHWEQQLVTVTEEDTGCVWAPKVCFDEKEGRYVVFFSGSDTDAVRMKVFYTTTTDFLHYTKPEILIDSHRNTEKQRYPYSLWPFAPKDVTYIDSTTICVDGEYYRFTKNETRKLIQEEHSTSICTGFEMVTDCVAGEVGVEGPGIYKLFDSDTYVLLMDGYIKPNQGVGYFPLVADTEALKKGKFRRLGKDEYDFPANARHGSVLAISEEAYQALENLQ